jgi:mono/diheme cytochrome c family protein
MGRAMLESVMLKLGFSRSRSVLRSARRGGTVWRWRNRGGPRLLLLPLGCLLALLALGVSRPARVAAKTDKKLEGAQLFATRGCSHCHGPDGEGTDSGPSLRSVHTRLSAAQIQHQIVNGGKQMPAFGGILNSNEIESLVAFLRAKKWITAPPLPE